jgi:hypothetical protein
MKRAARLLIGLVVATLAVTTLTAAPAQANESALRERAHARISVIMGDAVSSGIYSQAQANYVTSAILPSYVDPRQLSSRVEARTIEDFWTRIAEVRGVSVASAQSRLSNGWTLLRITGDSSDSVQRSIRNWLAGPTLRAYYDGNISLSQFNTLREDIDRSVDRLMRQSGGSDGRVTVSPRLN